MYCQTRDFMFQFLCEQLLKGGPMFGNQLLHKLLKKTLPEIHLKRLTALTNAVEALLFGKRLTLTALGRYSHCQAKERHCIRKMDRLLGNVRLQEEEKKFYSALNTWLIKPWQKPLINVDWSCVNKKKDWHILRASLGIRGRGYVVYQEVHPRGCENSPKVEKNFLRELKKVLPQGCRPIIISDAGFRGPWFKEVERQGFDWIGRVRSRACYQLIGKKLWHYTYDLYERATHKAHRLGEVILSKQTPLRCQLVLFKKRMQGRKHKNLKGAATNNNASNRCAKREREPWLLATSLPVEKDQDALRIVMFYKKRMQIEEDFRDSKSHQYGFSLRYSLTNDKRRLQLLLLIAVLASFVCWLTALSVMRKQLHWDYQSNSIKKRMVLSVTYLACQVIRRKVMFSEHELLQSILQLQQHIKDASLC